MFTNDNKAVIKERVDFVLERVALTDAHDKLPLKFLEECKNVWLLLALLSTGLNLFCDEPNSGLDPNTAILIDNLIKEITEEYDITTVINTHDMNSVMEIERILFLKDGLKAWEGTKEEIFRTDNQSVIDFVYSSNLFKKVREAYLKE
jgi:phospholipid/cholesterol/gamma-HCH transport system ATP-binding protein